ncbi:MAG: DNA alkylation repair protein [Tannerellaceae bacterium]|jgi:3-methyladenine DNA glycosylase AlkD|nr:DNA alkylation repair protein [Tannerellaceae bacterium]
MNADFVLSELLSIADAQKAAFLMRFFKCGPGQYADGDKFLGIVVPLTRNIVKACVDIPLSELEILVRNEYHEARLCAFLIGVAQFKKADENGRRDIYRFFMRNTNHANNWDLVDLAYPSVVGEFLADKERDVLYELAESDLLWDNRIAIVSTLNFIRKNDFSDTLALSEKLFSHKHDLIHKAIGWMLREVGKRDRELLSDFLEENSGKMARTTLRYAIEHYPEERRQYFLKKDKKI